MHHIFSATFFPRISSFYSSAVNHYRSQHLAILALQVWSWHHITRSPLGPLTSSAYPPPPSVSESRQKSVTTNSCSAKKKNVLFCRYAAAIVFTFEYCLIYIAQRAALTSSSPVSAIKARKEITPKSYVCTHDTSL